MRQEDAVQCRTRWSSGSAREVCELPPEIRSCVDHPTFITARIDDSHACDHAGFRRVIPARIVEATRLRYATILSDAENHDRWSVENSRVGCSVSRIASHEKDGDGCEDLACVHRASLYLYSPCFLMRRMSVAGVRSNSTASVLHTAIDCTPRRRKSDFPPLDDGRNRA